MAQMRYYSVDLLTGTVVSELPLYGVYMDRMLSAAGNFTGTLTLDTGVDVDDILLGGCIPGQQALFATRDELPIWCGPIWSRTYQSGSRTVQLTAQTYESVFERVVLTSDFNKTAIEQVTIASDLLTAVQAQTNNNFGLTGVYPGATGVTRTMSLKSAEYHFAIEVLQQLSQATNGLDFFVDSGKQFRVQATGVATASGLVYDYPGQIANYWFSESAARGAVRSAVTGTDGTTATSTHPFPTGRPYFWQTASFSDVRDVALLQKKADELVQMPFPNPTFQLNNTDDFDGWDKLGQTIQVIILDPRFPAGENMTARMMGWSFTPEQSESDEDFKFVLETD